MALVAVDEDGTEFIYKDVPERESNYWGYYGDQYCELPNGTIKKLIGRDLTWADEPVELEEEG